ncbi:uncharacterized protein [Amphiura filiformis]|uniref:uncharacterized protein n=1 Tax=Amphiura filiformis TaxID=82378 RepID=UPI003B223456
MILQCMPSLDADARNMSLAKCRLDQIRKEYLKDHENPNKHVCIVVHLDRSQSQTTSQPWHFSFLCGWQQFTIDSLESASPVLGDCLQKSLAEIFDSKDMQWQKVIDTNMLVWCFNCILYTENPRNVDSSLQLAHSIFQSDDVMKCFQRQIHKYLIRKERGSITSNSQDWQMEVACNTELLRTCSTLVGAMLEHMKQQIRIPLAKIIIFLEKVNSWKGSCNPLSTGKPNATENEKASKDEHVYWQACFQDTEVFDIAADDIGEPCGSETCPVPRSLLNLKYPFFIRFHQMIGSYLEWLLKGTSTNFDKCTDERLHLQLYDLIRNLPNFNHNDYLERHKEDFIYDLLNVYSERFAPNMSADLRVEVMKLLVAVPTPSADQGSDAFKCIADYYVFICLNQKILSAEMQLISVYEITKNDVTNLLRKLHNVKGGVVSNDESNIPSTSGAEPPRSPSEDMSHHEVEEVSPSDIHVDITEDTTQSRNYVDDIRTEDTLHAKIVTEICKALLPFGEVLDCYKGLEGWQQLTNFVLLLAEQVSIETSILTGQMCSETSILHFLRLCRDFVTLAVSLNLPEPHKFVISLANLALETDCKDVLDNEEVFHYINQQLDNSSIPKDSKEAFLSLYFNRCLDANLDTPIFCSILKSLVTQSGHLPVGSHPVLRNILHNDIKEDTDHDSLPLCEDVILTGKIDEERFPNIFAIDVELQSLKRECHFTIVCCDIIEDIAFYNNLSWVQISDVTSSDCQLIKTATKAVELVFNKPNDADDVMQNSSFQYVCAGSFLRAFIRATAEFFHLTKDPRLFTLGQKHHLLGNTLLNDILHDKYHEVSGLMLYLLKCMRTHISLFDLEKWVDTISDKLNVLNRLKFQEHLLTSRLGHNPLSYLPYYKESTSAVSLLLGQQRDRSKMNKLITTAKSSTDHQLGLVAAFSEMFYWVQSTTGMVDSDITEATWICGKIKEVLPASCSYFLQRLLTTEKTRDVLDLADADHDALHRKSVIIHATCLDIALNGKIHIALDEPMKESTPNTRCVNCICGFSLFYTISQRELTSCSICGRTCTADMEKDVTVASDVLESESDTPVVVQTIVRILHSSVRLSRLLQCEVSVGAGHTLQSENKPDDWIFDVTKSTGDGSSDLIPTREGIKTAEKTPGQNEQSPEDIESKVLKDQFEDNWNKLGETLGHDDETISLLLHTILRKILTAEKQKIEETLNSKMPELLMDSSTNQKAYIKRCLEAQGIHEKHIEYQVNELPCQQNESYKEHMKPRLLRRRSRPNFTDFKRQFLLNGRNIQTEHQFLRLYLRYQESLRYVRHLPIFLKWNSLITKQLGQSMERNQAKEQKIYSVLDTNGRTITSDQSSTETTSDIFREFTRAWNDVCDGWESLTGSCSQFGIMSDDRPVITCVMDTRDEDCPLHQIIRVLQNTQNEFLFNALSIASTSYSPSLNFLVREQGVSVIQRVPLDEARKEIIDFEWSDKLLQHSDVGTEYGDGCTISYNFLVIERLLARSLIMNKAILTDGAVFTQFAFSDELIHASSAIVLDVSQIIPQKDLDEDVKSAVITKIQSQKKFANKLLENLEIMLALLKKTGGESGKALEKYIERWSTQLPGSFSRDLLPEPQDAIKLCHVVALYRIPENHLADEYMDTLESRFRAALPGKMSNIIQLRMKGIGIKELETSARLIRLFAFRYLRPCSAVHTDTMNSHLLKIMGRASAGTMDLSVVSRVIDGLDVYVRQIFKIQEFIGAEVEQQQQQQQKSVERSDADAVNVETQNSSRSMTRQRSRQRRGGTDWAS